jgi:hypothetical protein
MNNRELRVATRLPVVATESTGDRAFYTKNLSMGGLFLLSETRWPVGSTMSLSMTFGDVRIELTARVTHLQRDGVGMCFVGPSDETRAQIKAIISEQMPHEAEGGAFQALQRAVGMGKPRGIQVVWTEGKSRHESTARDLSSAGAFFESETMPAEGATIMVYLSSITENDDHELEPELRGCAAEVLERTDAGFDVRFRTPSAEFRMAIDQALRNAAAAE